MNIKLINLFIDEKPSKVPLGYTLMQSCAHVGIDVPKFCYHDKLLIAGNCRICLVELTGSKKLLASCAVHASENAFVYTNTARVKLARQNVLEFLLANHPLDCPICDQGGECDLQDITAVFGADRGRFYESAKRAVLNKDFGPLIRTSMNRCIHCTRCVRFLSFSSGLSVLGTLGRGTSTEIGAYVDRFLHDELSGNITDLCPVGALTSKPYSFKVRPWELVSSEGLDIFDALNSTLTVDVAANKICRVLPYANELTNGGWLTNRARYAYDGLFFQRLTSCLLQVTFLNSFASKEMLKVARIAKFFVKISWHASTLIVARKFFNKRVSMIVAEVGAVADLVTVYSSLEFFSLLGASLSSEFTQFTANGQDFNEIFLFNSSLRELASTPSFCFFLATNPRLESPLINLRLTKLQGDFATPFYRVGASIQYHPYLIKLLSNNIKTFFEICEFKHSFCKNLYSKTFSSAPFFLIGATFLSSAVGFFVIGALFAFIRRLTNVTTLPYSTKAHFESFNVLGLYSGWIHNFDAGVARPILDFSATFEKLKKKKNSVSLYYSVGADSNFLLQGLNTLAFDWVIYQGSHGTGVAGQAHLILPTMSYIEKTVFFKNLLGTVQTSSGAVIYSKYPKTSVEIFLDILLYTGDTFLKNFFYFNFKRAVLYNFSLDTRTEILLNVVPSSIFMPRVVSSYYYISTYWAYFSYKFDTKNFRSADIVNFFLNFFGHVSGSRLYCKPLASSLVNYYSDPALVALSASKTMNTCSSLFLKKNLTLLQLHL